MRRLGRSNTGRCGEPPVTMRCDHARRRLQRREAAFCVGARERAADRCLSSVLVIPSRRGIAPEGCAGRVRPSIAGASPVLERMLSGKASGADEATGAGPARGLGLPADLLANTVEPARQLRQALSPLSAAVSRRVTPHALTVPRSVGVLPGLPRRRRRGRRAAVGGGSEVPASVQRRGHRSSVELVLRPIDSLPTEAGRTERTVDWTRCLLAALSSHSDISEEH